MTDVDVRKLALESAISIMHGDSATREFFENEINTDATLSTDAPRGMAQILVKIAGAMEPILRDYLDKGKS
jgi:hypothetical protein